jgi:flagellar FliJ protein
MQRFRFRLEQVLRFRRNQEEGVQRELSLRQAELLRIDGKLRELRAVMSRFVRETGYGQGEFSPLEAVAVDNYIARLAGSIKGLQVLRRRAETEVERFRELLVQARKARKVIEVLKQRQWERYQEELNREEAVNLDDVTQNLRASRERLSLEETPLEDL